MEFDKAVADHTEAFRLDPKNVQNHDCRGFARAKKNQFDKAIADCNQAIRLDPNDPWAYKTRGAARSNNGEHEKAIADYDMAIKLNPKDTGSLYNRAAELALRGDVPKAIADYQEAIIRDPKDMFSLNALAWIRATCPNAKFRDGMLAIELATKGCKLTEWKEGYLLDTLASAYAEAGDFEKAVDFQKKANKLYTETEDKKKGGEKLQLFRDKKPYRDNR